jgi:hypothetical protein
MIKMVEAAGVEPDTRVKNTQVIDSENARIGMISEIAKSTVRSLYGHFPERPQLPNSTFGRPFWRKKHSEVSLTVFHTPLWDLTNRGLAVLGAVVSNETSGDSTVPMPTKTEQRANTDPEP